MSAFPGFVGYLGSLANLLGLGVLFDGILVSVQSIGVGCITFHNISKIYLQAFCLFSTFQLEQ
jgi:hypothetical protein